MSKGTELIGILTFWTFTIGHLTDVAHENKKYKQLISWLFSIYIIFIVLDLIWEAFV